MSNNLCADRRNLTKCYVCRRVMNLSKYVSYFIDAILLRLVSRINTYIDVSFIKSLNYSKSAN